MNNVDSFKGGEAPLTSSDKTLQSLFEKPLDGEVLMEIVKEEESELAKSLLNPVENEDFENVTRWLYASGNEYKPFLTFMLLAKKADIEASKECPPNNDLISFFQGLDTFDEAKRAAAHCAECEDCQSVIFDETLILNNWHSAVKDTRAAAKRLGIGDISGQEEDDDDKAQNELIRFQMQKEEVLGLLGELTISNLF